MTKKLLLLLITMGLAFTITAKAQQHATVDGILADLYGSITFDENHAPNFDLFQSLFIDGARLISVKDTTTYELSIQDYINSMTKSRESGKIKSFKEHELHRETEQYGNIMHVFSTYKSNIEAAGRPDSARGINSIQMLRQNGEWKIVSLIWYEENKAHPLPEKYLPESE